MTDKKRLKEAVKYFRTRKGFNRVFTALKTKYKSIGRIGGSIVLSDVTEDEADALSGLMRKSYYGCKEITLSAAEIENALIDTRFGGIPLLEILTEYFGEELISNKESRILHEEAREKYFNHVLGEIEHDKWGQAYAKWLRSVIETKETPYIQLMRRYEKEPSELRKSIIAVADGLNLLKKNDGLKRLAVFAADLTGDPHFFDEGTENCSLLMCALSYFWSIPLPENAEGRSEMFLKCGLTKDDISIYTVTVGLKGRTKANIHDGQEAFHSGMAGFAKLREPLHLSLLNIWNLEEIMPAYGNNIVYVVENPSVFSGILDGLEDRRVSMLCSNGQPRLSTLLLMDKLCQKDITIYYAGDYDPEGLQIAVRLKKRYGGRFKYWRYDVDDYLSALSDNEISPGGIKKLKKISDEDIQGLINKMVETGLAGYQETILQIYLEDIL